MKKQIVAILIALVVVTSFSLAAMLPTSAEGESTNPAVRIAYKPEEDAKFKFVTVYPIEIEIKEKGDTFLVSIDYNSETEKSKALYLNLEYAELTARDDFISVEMRDEAGKTGKDFAEEQIMAISDWGQLQVIVKESGGKKRTISAHTASFALSDEEYTPKGETPGFEAAFAIAGLLALAYLLKRRK